MQERQGELVKIFQDSTSLFSIINLVDLWAANMLNLQCSKLDN